MERKEKAVIGFTTVTMAFTAAGCSGEKDQTSNTKNCIHTFTNAHNGKETEIVIPDGATYQTTKAGEVIGRFICINGEREQQENAVPAVRTFKLNEEGELLDHK